MKHFARVPNSREAIKYLQFSFSMSGKANYKNLSHQLLQFALSICFSTWGNHLDTPCRKTNGVNLGQDKKQQKLMKTFNLHEIISFTF